MKMDSESVTGDVNDLMLFSGNSNRELALEICNFLGRTIGKASVLTFSDGEIFVEIKENVRGRDVFVLQSTSSPVNEYMVELLIMIDALKRASASQITAVLPYYGYARQDRKVAPRRPISAKLVADLITIAGASRVLAMDLHAGQIQGFFNIPVDHLFATPVLIEYLRKHFVDDMVLVSPDAGGVERARAFAKRLKTDLAIIDQRAEEHDVTQAMNIIGDIKGRNAVILDDMVDTGRTLNQAAMALQECGASHIYACVTHAVLSGSSIEILDASPIEKLVVTNTISLNEKARSWKKIECLSVAGLLGEAIKRIHMKDSVSSLFV